MNSMKKYCYFRGSWSSGYVGTGTTIHKIKGTKTVCGLSIKNAIGFLDQPVLWFDKKSRTVCSGKCLRCFKE